MFNTQQGRFCHIQISFLLAFGIKHFILSKKQTVLPNKRKKQVSYFILLELDDDECLAVPTDIGSTCKIASLR